MTFRRENIPIRDARKVPGPWWATIKRDGRDLVQVKCPHGHIADLIDHAITDDGAVTPSLVCPEEGCGFHAFVNLEGFTR